MKNVFLKLKIRLKSIQIIAIGFGIIILFGTILLTFPISSQSGEWSSFYDCFLTATSATCVTGLIVQDTGTYWSLFGQTIILMLIQIGGIGFMTVATLFAFVFGKKITLKQRGLLQESVNTNYPGGLEKLTKKIIIGTFTVEGIGALILGIRFSLDFGVLKGMYYGVFHSISAFCNAGFDLLGAEFSKYCSLTNYYDDIVVNITIISLIMIGGIGFVVWNDVCTHKHHLKKYSIHSKIVLSVTLALLIFGTAFFFVMENNNNPQFAGESFKNKLLLSFFQSGTTRTAGFNTCDLEGLSTGSKLLTIIYMFIGGSPGSTAGGIKTTTFVVLILSLIATLKGTTDLNIFKRRLETDASRKANAVVLTNMFFAIFATIVISINHNFPLEDLFIETFSAIGTVGLSTGITRELNGLERIIICLLMYCGRIGSLSFAISFAKSKVHNIRRPETKISIG